MQKAKEVAVFKWLAPKGNTEKGHPGIVMAISGLALAFALLFVLPACNQGREAPSIDEDKLVQVLIDVHIAEAAVQTLRGGTRDSVINAYYGQICEIHGLDRQEFETTMEMLRKDPKYVEGLYSRIMTEMERQEVESKEE